MASAPFEVIRELGRGAAGQVYEVRRPGDPRRLVAKVLVAPSDKARVRFQREGEVLARLRHPGVVSVHDNGVLPDGRPYLLMDLVVGSSLQDLLTQGGACDPDRAVEIVAQLATALGHAHAQGITHRDVKPANVLLDETGEVRLTDFGIAFEAEAQRLTQTGGVVGTPAYMAPEQLTGDRDRIGPATDVYACGVVLYELLTGELPAGQAIVRTSSAANPRARNPAISRALGALVRRCLEPEPERRFRDGQALAAALRALEADPPRRGPALLVAGLGLAVLVLGAAALAAGRAAPTSTPTVEPTAEPTRGVAPTAATPTPSGPPALRLALRVGDRFDCRLRIQELRGDLTNRLTWRAAHHVRSQTPDGNLRIVGTVKAGTLEQSAGTGWRVVYDSLQRIQEPGFEALNELLGKEYAYVQDPASGRVYGFSGGAPLAAHLTRSGFPGYWLEDRSLLFMFNGLWSPLPGRPVERRDSWALKRLAILYDLHDKRSFRCAVVGVHDGRYRLRFGAPPRPGVLGGRRIAWGELDWAAGRVVRAELNLRAAESVIRWSLLPN